MKIKKKIDIEIETLPFKKRQCSGSCGFYAEYNYQIEWCYLFNNEINDSERLKKCIKTFGEKNDNP